MQYPQWIWHNGNIKPWAEATTHVMSHALHYGSSVFEGIRSYATPSGPVIFRLTDHNRRLYASARIHEIDIPYSLDELNAACREVLKANGHTTDYLRPVAYRGLGGFGEGIALASTGLLSEGAGENLFLVFDGALHTSPVSAA
ncbi:MAG: hypothetical protein EOP93_18990, partial [Lysobacteraceae bacterium]